MLLWKQSLFDFSFGSGYYLRGIANGHSSGGMDGQTIAFFIKAGKHRSSAAQFLWGMTATLLTIGLFAGRRSSSGIIQPLSILSGG
jgi:hypothetical protein